MKDKIIYIKSVELLEDKYCLNKGLKIEFSQLTLLVGDQGTGKSTLLQLLQENSDILNLEFTDDVIQNGVDHYYFDSEKMNPRIQDLHNFSNPNGTRKGIGIGGALQARFMSHGEVLQQYTVNNISKSKDCILLLDEPEAALSLKNQFKLVKSVKKALSNKVQLIMATHCLPLIEAFEEVYSMDTMEKMKSSDYINFIKK